jgi:nucleotidyltransferase substrate binding protein (TIGR01987 family)
MVKKKLLNEIKSIILKYIEPERIYIYGSQVNGEATVNSDIDIAYYDENSKKDSLIKDEISQIDTLISIDVKNIAKTEERFKERVISTGKVIYSANKKLRAEDGLYNFSNALDRFISSIEREDEIKNEGFGDIYLDLTVKRFEFTYEMSWRALKRYLDFVGMDVKNPRATFKEAYLQEIIDEENIWLDMIEQRNLSSHIYDEYEISDIVNKVEFYKNAFIKLRNRLKKLLKEV